MRFHPTRARLARMSLLCWLVASTAQAQGADTLYYPKFARIEQPAGMMAFDSCIKPEWPRASLRNEETGTVTLRFTLAPTGRLLKYDIVKSSGFPALDLAAAAGLSTCKFKPGSIAGKPVQAVSYMQYVWTLE